MLRFLQIRDFAIVDSLDLEVNAGFTCITGETGAGKSILVGALGLLSGERADTASIRSGADRAELSAEFQLSEGDPALQWLQAAELDDGRSCLLRRMITANGRSRAWINGTIVTLQQLAELGELLVEIHGQNEHIRLVRSDEQFRLLDGGGQHDAELRDTLDRYEAWRALDDEKRSLLDERPLDAGERDLLQYQLQELENDMLPPAEFAELEAEHRMLARGSEILEALESALATLEAEPSGVSRSLHLAAERLDRHSGLDAEIASAVGLLREAVINCDEALGSIQAALSRLDLSPDRMSRVERRLNLQHDLARKHRVQPEQLGETLELLRARLERSGSLEQRLQAIESELAGALKDYQDAAARLHQQRAGRAGSLSAKVTDLMQELGMEGGRFEFEVRYDPGHAPSGRGNDRLELRVSANSGIPPGPLRKVASGGELSRISLAIKVASRAESAALTQVFDEVDAGIGGDTANAVGALLRSLAAGSQALCVTHLAQVAVFADQQIQVLKSTGEAESRVRTSYLREADRVDEIARMLGGRLSEQSRAHAAELLATASTHH
ncbi:MAG TPA: DNA repair protein RecN [Xanthomonadales bacterium]|nr:DNA repair protein RecN [Xanthomonadales bacterium]